MAVPFVPPLQVISVCDEDAVNAEGCVIVTCCVVVQPPESVMVQVYVPAERPVAVAALPPLGAQL